MSQRRGFGAWLVELFSLVFVLVFVKLIARGFRRNPWATALVLLAILSGSFVACGMVMATGAAERSQPTERTTRPSAPPPP